ncbi:hypothetical protein BKA61DRAFT_181782 [Leptodontidium sp. MPI-SDFR-AT-0119]|nr:hypothetical protein BKA61DRAFT_181782 [Leptodontidium sp. MPI-SDFR-AT-0119]
MVQIRAARSVPVNPPGAAFILKHTQLWTALQRKVRHATEFVPLMKSCTVLKDEGDVVLRDAILVQENGAVREMREEVTSYSQQWIIFRQTDGSTTTNLISNSPQEGDEGLILSYIFEWNYPNLKEESREYDEIVAATEKMALTAVEKSIEVSRSMVTEGKIQ